MKDEPHNLGNLLLMARKITPAQLKEGLAEQARTGRHLGTSLIGIGALDPWELAKTLMRQAEIRGEKVDYVALGRAMLAAVSLRQFRMQQLQHDVRAAAEKI